MLTPAKAAIPQAFKALRRNGTLILVGWPRPLSSCLVDTVLKGITIRGATWVARGLAAVFGPAREGGSPARAHAWIGGGAVAGSDGAR